jgi:acyl-coenzyme A synthetase/AMP-(fatty) acid ligase/acyl carrier protein
MIQEKVTIYHSVPTTFRRFAEAAGPERRFPDLRFIVLGGEPAYNADFELFRKRFGGRARFVNLYGSTESTINSFCTLDREARLLRPIVSTGYPVEGGEMLLLDRNGNAAEIYGEIAIRSPHVALGYWQRAALTRDVFDEGVEGRRVYRTGDMGRRLPDGTIECVGRKDFQLKVRGYRVEPGEVEAVLADHPAVKETAVLGCPDGQGETRLVAYWVGRPDSNPSTGELRGFLKLKLPEAMVPSVFVRVPRMPQTPNGKLDRRALPAPDSITPETAVDLAPPRTPIEKELARLWTEILGVEVSSVHGNFIELGGHSLRAMQVISRIRDRFQVDLPLRSVFEAPTVAGLALLVSRALSEAKALDELKAP